MTAFNKTWVFIKNEGQREWLENKNPLSQYNPMGNVDQPYDDLSAARKLHEIEEKIKQLEQQREIIRQMRGNMGNVDPRAHPDWEQKPVAPDPNPFKTNFAPMCEVCKATPALLNSRMCGTCTNEKEAIEQRNQQSRNNLQDRQDVSDSFIDYR